MDACFSYDPFYSVLNSLTSIYIIINVNSIGYISRKRYYIGLILFRIQYRKRGIRNIYGY